MKCLFLQLTPKYAYACIILLFHNLFQRFDYDQTTLEIRNQVASDGEHLEIFVTIIRQYSSIEWRNLIDNDKRSSMSKRISMTHFYQFQVRWMKPFSKLTSPLLSSFFDDDAIGCVDNMFDSCPYTCHLISLKILEDFQVLFKLFKIIKTKESQSYK